MFRSIVSESTNDTWIGGYFYHYWMPFGYLVNKSYYLFFCWGSEHHIAINSTSLVIYQLEGIGLVLSGPVGARWQGRRGSSNATNKELTRSLTLAADSTLAVSTLTPNLVGAQIRYQYGGDVTPWVTLKIGGTIYLLFLDLIISCKGRNSFVACHWATVCMKDNHLLS